MLLLLAQVLEEPSGLSVASGALQRDLAMSHKCLSCVFLGSTAVVLSLKMVMIETSRFCSGRSTIGVETRPRSHPASVAQNKRSYFGGVRVIGLRPSCTFLICESSWRAEARCRKSVLSQ